MASSSGNATRVVVHVVYFTARSHTRSHAHGASRALTQVNMHVPDVMAAVGSADVGVQLSPQPFEPANTTCANDTQCLFAGVNPQLMVWYFDYLGFDANPCTFLSEV